jgi:acetyl esterase/lipase
LNSPAAVAMSSRNLVDAELVALIDALPDTPFTLETLPAIRAGMQFPFPPLLNTDVEVERKIIPGPAGAPDVPVLICRPKTARSDRGGILHIHGGGFVLGSVSLFEPVARNTVAALDCVIVSVDYRLAPETRFPGALEDCYAALGWMMTNAEALGVARGRIGVMGESAGGGLAAALALYARDKGEYALAFQHLVYPMLDDRTCVAKNPHPFTGEFIWTADKNAFGWSALLGKPPGSEDVSPYAAPARAGNLEGLPPTFIATGALDLFLEEDMDYARRLMRAGVAVELHVYPGAFHGFDFAVTSAVAQTARRDRHAALAKALR